MNGPDPEPSLTPTPKVAAAGIGGAVAVIVVWILSAWVDVPAEVAAAIAAICSFVGGYLRSENT